MANRTITVPADYVEWVRKGTVEEIGFDARCIKDLAVDDLRSTLRYIDGNVAVLRALSVQPEGDVELEEGTETLAHIIETTGRKVIAPALAEAMEVGPWDMDYVRDKLDGLLHAMDWTVETASYLHEQVRLDCEGAAA